MPREQKVSHLLVTCIKILVVNTTCVHIVALATSQSQFSTVYCNTDIFCFIVPAIRHKESNWAKFLMQDLKGAVCAPAHLFHRVGNSPPPPLPLILWHFHVRLQKSLLDCTLLVNFLSVIGLTHFDRIKKYFPMFLLGMQMELYLCHAQSANFNILKFQLCSTCKGRGVRTGLQIKSSRIYMFLALWLFPSRCIYGLLTKCEVDIGQVLSLYVYGMRRSGL